ncbi:TetR/AcrR family transcriptional regulator [Pseudomonas sp. J452]|uniref:TetR/AcrR family transcriptional regulator n=1 Tax=Pseudomonas sp. J452 TaxID=2898441 RepID=UPI0021AE0D37|nr:TetR/AcrR family transcriptional regulator [Pseudomonas sp. J452]UUY08663.1 TetR/AcrR family transcriptional regulator [Pseudomonas sp. J452]
MAAAEVVFSRLGYGGASIELIASEAGYSKGAVYSNFPSKDALFLELLRAHMERDFQEQEQIVGMSSEEVIRESSRWLKSMHSRINLPALTMELQLHARRSPEFAKDFYALQEQKFTIIAQILTKYFAACSAKLPANAMDLARTIDALSHGLSLQRPLREPGTINEAGRMIADLLEILVASGRGQFTEEHKEASHPPPSTHQTKEAKNLLEKARRKLPRAQPAN